MKAGLSEAREAGDATGSEAVGSGVKGGKEAALEDGAEGIGCHANADPDAGKAELRHVADVGTVEDLPILQVAAAAETDSAGADAAQGAGDAGEVAAGELARESGLFGGFGWGYRCAFAGWLRRLRALAGRLCGCGDAGQ